MYTDSVNRDYKFLDGQDIVPVQLVAFSFATKFCLRICRRYLRYLGFLPNFCPAICLFAFTLEIFTVLVLKTLVQRIYFLKFVVTDLIYSFDRRAQNFGFHVTARSQLIKNDRKRSQNFQSSAITITGSQTIAEVCFHMMTDDRRIFCDLRSYGNQALYKETNRRSTQKVCQPHQIAFVEFPFKPHVS